MALAEPSSNTPLSEMLSTILTKRVWAFKSFLQSSALFPQYPHAFSVCVATVSLSFPGSLVRRRFARLQDSGRGK
jgi:hypothetical protein